jgi:hypothetical protein
LNPYQPAGSGPTYDRQGNGALLVQPLSGGTATAAVAAGAGTTTISTAMGRFCRVLITTAGTGTGGVEFYDSATVAIGTVVGYIPATVAIGTLFSFEMPLANGLTVAVPANGPGMTVSYA